MPAAERHIASHLFNIAVLVIGAGALAWLLQQLGLDTVRRVLGDIGGWFVVIVALDVASLACDAAAIHQFMRPEARMIAYWRVLAAQVGGRAINILTPGGALGEATKVTMLVTHVPRGRVVSSIVLLNLAGFYIQVAIVILGVPLTAAFVELPASLTAIVWAGLAVVVAIVIGLIVLIQRGALGTLLASARTINLLSRERAERWASKLREIDGHIREVQSHPTAGTRIGVLLICGSKVCTWSATTVVLYVVGVQLGFTLICGVVSVGVLIGWIASVVPFGLGVADGANYALFNVLGAAGAHGVFVTLIGRARTLAIALLGLVVMAAGHSANRLELARRNRLMARLAAQRATQTS